MDFFIIAQSVNKGIHVELSDTALKQSHLCRVQTADPLYRSSMMHSSRLASASIEDACTQH